MRLRFTSILKTAAKSEQTNVTTALGKKIFASEGCAGCHTPPLYTNNKLTPPRGSISRRDIARDSTYWRCRSALIRVSRKRPGGALAITSAFAEGVWYRGPFGHGGWSTLEDWFDARRLRDDYVPTGFKGYRVSTRAVEGHQYGLNLSLKTRKR